MSTSFFTVPASQRKRKRAETSVPAVKKRNVDTTGSQSAKAPRRREREDSIASEESSDENNEDFFAEEEEGSADSSEDEAETATDKRRRLAERYLKNVEADVEDDIGFDAAQIDRDLIAERLKEDVAENKGKIYRNIASGLDLEAASHSFGKSDQQYSITGCAMRLPYVWTISKNLIVAKWELADPNPPTSDGGEQPTNITARRKPKRLLWKKGNKNKGRDRSFLGHTGAIISITVSDSGKYLATGDENARMIIWDADTLTPRKLFTDHRAAVTSLSFRRNTEQLFSASADRTIKIYQAAELAYIETLFGHQDTVVGIAGGLDSQETCVSVGARDRTARLWKVVEENQLVFRGGGTARQKGMEKLRKDRFGVKERAEADQDETEAVAFAEGSIDCVALLDGGLFVTGSDNGAISLWSVHKKKPLHTLPLAHGRDPPLAAEEMSADADAATLGLKSSRLPRYITALATIPFADLIITASWDGWIRAWRVGLDKRSIEELGKIGQVTTSEANEVDGAANAEQGTSLIRGIINGLSVCERGDRGKDGVCVVAAVGKEPRLGRWMKGKGRNGIYVFEVPKKALANGVADDETDDSDDA